MSSTRARTRPVIPPVRQPVASRDPGLLASCLEDAAHFPGGHAEAVAFPTSEGDVAALVRQGRAVLAVGAQSSLTGGATPMGELVLSLARWREPVRVDGDRVTVPPGLTLAELGEALAPHGRWYPPAPTFDGATIGGSIATNAAGAATFKYGTTRAWVEAITVVLASGEVLDLARGEVRAGADGIFEIEQSCGITRVPVPRYRLPDVPKCSAGYFAAPGMDLVDLFIGAEGTLGIVTSATLRTAAAPPAVAHALVWCRDEAEGLALVAAFRDASRRTWADGDPCGIDVAAIEHMDRRSLDLVREDGAGRQIGLAIPRDAALALLVQLELPAGATAAQCYADLGATGEGTGPDTPLVRAARLLDRAGLLDRTELALPGEIARARQLGALREAVPAAVNRRVGLAKQRIDARIEKTAADMIMPFDRFAEAMRLFHDAFGRRGLDVAIWGHASDGNVHPNVVPRSYADVQQGKDAILECGRAIVAMGGSPLAEHGVGRSAIKHQLLELLYGRDGLDDMRAVKRALDPEWRLAPGVIVPRASQLTPNN